MPADAPGGDDLTRQCLSFLDILESERLHDAILAVAAEAVGAGGGVLWTGDRELSVAAVRGLAAAGRRLDPVRVDGPMGPKLHDGEAFHWPDEKDPHATLRVPVVAHGQVRGLIELTDKIEGTVYTPVEMRRAETIATFAAVALKNAAAVQTLKRRSLKDPETGTYNLLYFVEYAGKEIYKARRYGRKFSLVVIKIDNLHKLRSLFSPDLVDDLVRRLISSIRGALRDADLVAKVVDDEFYLLLPETDYLGARLFIQKIQRAFRRTRHASELDRTHPVLISCGAASFPRDGADFDSLLARCQAQIEDFRGSLHRKLALGEMGLWPMAELFIGQETWYRKIESELPPKPLAITEDQQARSRHVLMDPTLHRRIQLEALAEVHRNRQVRGVLYVAARQTSDLETIAAASADLAGANTTVFVLARQDATTIDVPGMTVLHVDDPELAAHEATLLMTESTSYGFIGRHAADGRVYGFHTCDPILVETFVAKLQNQYYLQGRF